MKPQDINWNPLSAWINQTLGTEVDMTMDFSEKWPTITCPNLYKESAIFKAVFKKVTVNFFGFWEIKDDEGNIIGFSGNVNLWYEQWNGGTNGAEIGTFWVEEGRWKFESIRVKSERISAPFLTRNPL